MPRSLEALLPLVSRLVSDRGRGHSLRELSAVAGWSPAYLQRRFAALVGESPKRLANRLRLERAALQLIREETPVLEIALDNGFESHEGFTRAFRQRFGIPPREYRARRRPPGGASTLSVHAAHVERVAPCVGLYRLMRQQTKERGSVSYTIVRKEIEEAPVLFQRDRIGRDEIAETLSRILPAVFAYATRAGIPLAGRPFLRSEATGPGLLSIQAGMPVGEGAQGDDDIESGSLPGGPVAFTLHVGPYEALPAAYAAVERWLEENGLETGGAPWESYITDPGEVADPSEWQTEIYWPIKR